jgi:positive regulator of sigma E activity
MFMISYGDGALETHPGRVENLVGNTAYITIFPKSACSSCASTSSCKTLNGKNSKVLKIRHEQDLVLGQKVMVGVSNSTGIISIILSFLVPVILILASVFTLNSLGFPEEQSALIATGVFGLYLLFLFLLRKPIERKMRIHILPSESV